jgi:hypothetical protein
VKRRKKKKKERKQLEMNRRRIGGYRSTIRSMGYLPSTSGGSKPIDANKEKRRKRKKEAKGKRKKEEVQEG